MSKKKKRRVPRPQATFPDERSKKCKMVSLGRWKRDTEFLRFRCTRHKHLARTDILVKADSMYHDMIKPWEVPGDGPDYSIVDWWE